MKENKKFNAFPIQGKYSVENYYMRLSDASGETGLILNGDTIHYQFEVDQYTLLITHYDYYDGVSYWFSLIDKKNKLLDVVFTPDSFGFMELEEVGINHIKFGFFQSEDKWSLKVLLGGHFSLKPQEIAKRSPRYWFSKKYLALQNYGKA